jgi:ketosteroid isomerase-like protein
VKLCLVPLIVAGLSAQTNADPIEQVRRAETAFARTMADRDHAAFVSFLAEEAVFIGRNRVLRGAKEVAAGWKALYDSPQAPFSWEPNQIQVLDSGTLAISSGPVRDSSGKRIGTFNSIWRREPDGRWKIVIDHGCPPCDCAP